MRRANDVGNLAIGGLEMDPVTASASVTLLPTGGPPCHDSPAAPFCI
jgi:hypothetical protein